MSMALTIVANQKRSCSRLTIPRSMRNSLSP